MRKVPGKMPTNVISNLKQIVIPPTKLDLISGKTLSSKLGMKIHLPQDYIDLINQYGLGYFTVNGNFSLQIIDLITNRGVSVAQEFLDYAREGHSEYPERYPKVFSTVSGLLPWGADDQGGTYYWWVEGLPNTWKVIADIRVKMIRYQYSMSEFLLALYSNELREVFPNSNMSTSEIGFSSYSE